MKLCLLGDTHFRDNTPEGRTDDNFRFTCMSKLDQVLDIADRNDCEAIIQAGDFFDKPNPPKSLICDIIDLLRESNMKFYSIHGQHDLSFHSLKYKEDSAIRVIQSALPNMFMLADDTYYGDKISHKENVCIYGYSYGEIPKKPLKSDNVFDICVSHAMVGNEELYKDQLIIDPVEYMKKYPWFDLYLLGDYHYSYEFVNNDKTIINSGAMLRLTRSSRDCASKPHVVIFDTETRTYEIKYLSVLDNPFKEMEREKENNKVLEKFVDKLRKEGKIGTSFFDNFDVYVNKNNIESKIVKIINDEFV